MPKSGKIRVGASRAMLDVLSDGEFHTFQEIVPKVAPFVNEGSVTDAISGLASALRCERMGIRGRNDQQARWRPDLYLEEENKEGGHERRQFKDGMRAALKGLLGLRAFQTLITDPGEKVNPTQHYLLDLAQQIFREGLNGKEDADGHAERLA